MSFLNYALFIVELEHSSSLIKRLYLKTKYVSRQLLGLIDHAGCILSLDRAFHNHTHVLSTILGHFCLARSLNFALFEVCAWNSWLYAAQDCLSILVSAVSARNSCCIWVIDSSAFCCCLDLDLGVSVQQADKLLQLGLCDLGMAPYVLALLLIGLLVH